MLRRVVLPLTLILLGSLMSVTQPNVSLAQRKPTLAQQLRGGLGPEGPIKFRGVALPPALTSRTQAAAAAEEDEVWSWWWTWRYKQKNGEPLFDAHFSAWWTTNAAGTRNLIVEAGCDGIEHNALEETPCREFLWVGPTGGPETSVRAQYRFYQRTGPGFWPKWVYRFRIEAHVKSDHTIYGTTYYEDDLVWG